MTETIQVCLLDFNKGQLMGLPKNPRFFRDYRFEAMKKSIQDSPEMLELRELIIFPYNDGRYIVVLYTRMIIRVFLVTFPLLRLHKAMHNYYQQIKDVKEDPNKVNQAKQVFQGVNTLINLAKTELEYRKYLDTTDPLNK